MNSRGSVGPVTEGQPRRDGQSGHFFALRQDQVANDAVGDSAIQKALPTSTTTQMTQTSLEKWMRLVGATRQLSYQGEKSDTFQSDASNMRYRLQRTYFDQERQTIPQSPQVPDQRLQAYRDAAPHAAEAVAINFVV